MPNYLTIREIAEKLSCSPQTVRSLVKKGAVRSFRVGRFVRVDAESFSNMTGAAHESGAVQS